MGIPDRKKPPKPPKEHPLTWPSFKREEYLRAYDAWLAGKTPGERFELVLMGLDTPVPEDRLASPRGSDDREEAMAAADRALELIPSAEPNPAEVAELADDLLDPEFVAKQAVAADRDAAVSAICRVLPAIIDARDPRLEASIIALAVPVADGARGTVGARQGITADDLAERHDVDAVEIAERVQSWRLRIGVSRLALGWVRYVLGPILRDDQPMLEACIIASAASIHLRQGQSWRKQSEAFGRSVAMWSARVDQWVTKLRLPPPSDAKRNTDAYRFSNPRQLPSK